VAETFAAGILMREHLAADEGSGAPENAIYNVFNALKQIGVRLLQA
jgi:hypothetical protein